jgi:hypothetical protein
LIKEGFTFALIMRTIKNILSVAVLASILLVSYNTYASVIVTGTIETKKTSEKFSLRNLNATAHKTATFATLKASFQYKGLAGLNSKENNKSNSSYLMYNKGNISYVIPYHHNVLSKFKTPTAP